MINSIVTHLESSTSGFKVIDNAHDLQPQETKLADTPGLFVFRNNSQAENSNGDVSVKQKRMITISVHLVSDVNDLDSNEIKLFNSLLGYQISSEYRGLEFLKDEVVSITGKIAWHEYQFMTWHTIREQK